MARKSKKWTEIILRQAIGEAIYSRHLQKKPIDREAIKRRYLGKCPKQSEFIKSFIDSYADQLESQPRGENQIETSTLTESSNVSPADITASDQPGSRYQAQSSPPPVVFQKRPPPTKASASTTKQVHKIESHCTQDGSEKSFDNSVADYLDNENDTGELINIRLQEFKDDLIGSMNRSTPVATFSLPSLESQWQLLSPTDGQKEHIRDKVLTEHAVLFSPLLESRGSGLPSQCALLGSISMAANGHSDPRIMLNTNIPFSAFVCGVQGSGKSHTTACMIENCSMTMPALGTLKRSVSTLVLHFDEYTSTVSSQPSEAAFLARVLPQYVHGKPVPVRVLVSPTNIHNLGKLYAQIPNIEVRPFKLQPKHLNISMMLSLMSVPQGGGMPLYMAQVTRILRVMAMESGGYFDYSDFRGRLNALKLDRSQTPFLYQRLDLLDSYLDLEEKGKNDYFLGGGVTILDLSCPFVDQGTACILFRIAIDLFLGAHPSRGKMIVADEAHKYMADTPAAKVLTETFLTIIRLQRHLGARVIISTQEPTISPRLIDLCSLTIIHRFTSPEWYKTIEKHVPMDDGNTTHHGQRVLEGFRQITGLRTGEAVVFASSAHIVREDGAVIDTARKTFKMMIRNRVTWDGGRSIVCIR